jgi:hypothetical protein
VNVESHGGGDDAGWGKLLTHLPELSDIWERVGGMDKGVRISHISI